MSKKAKKKREKADEHAQDSVVGGQKSDEEPDMKHPGYDSLDILDGPDRERWESAPSDSF